MARSLTGHNSGGMINGEALRRHVTRIITLLGEKDEIGEKIKEVYDEAKEAGFVTKILREQVREQRLDPDVLTERLALMDAYRQALGQLADTPLGQWGIEEEVEQADRPKRRRRSQAVVTPIEAARAHLGGAADSETRMDEDLDRIIADDSAA